MSVFREVLIFLNDIGVYDVVLPLLLIFAMVFAILEKTKIFGMEKVGEQQVTRKNVNAMIAFVMAFFVVASAQLVAVIHELVANVSLLLVMFVMFLLLIGIFHKDEELMLKDKWKTTFMVISFLAIILIFLNSLGWLMFIWMNFQMIWTSTLFATALLLGGVAFLIWLIVRTPNPDKKKD